MNEYLLWLLLALALLLLCLLIQLYRIEHKRRQLEARIGRELAMRLDRELDAIIRGKKA